MTSRGPMQLNIRWLFNHIRVSATHHAVIYFSVGLVAVCLWSAALSIGLLHSNSERLLTLWGDSGEINFFLADGVSLEEKQKLLAQLSEDQRLRKISAFDGKELMVEIQEQNPSGSSLSYQRMMEDEELMALLPTGIRAELSPTISVSARLEALKSLAQFYEKNPAVVQATFGTDFTEQFRSLQKTSSLVFSALIVFIVFVTVLLSYQLNRVAVFARRSEIEILRLLGATRSFIHMPFFVETTLLALLSAGAATALVWNAFGFIQGSLANSPWTGTMAEQLQGPTPLQIALCILAVVVVNLLGTSMALRKTE